MFQVWGDHLVFLVKTTYLNGSKGIGITPFTWVNNLIWIFKYENGDEHNVAVKIVLLKRD